MIKAMAEEIFDDYKFFDEEYGDTYPLQYKNKEEIIESYERGIKND